MYDVYINSHILYGGLDVRCLHALLEHVYVCMYIWSCVWFLLTI